MLKAAGIIIIIIVTTLTGNYFSNMLKVRVVNLKKINYMIDEITTMIRFKSSTVYEISEILKSSGRFSDFEFLYKIDKEVPFQQSWYNSVLSYSPCGMKKSDVELLADIGRKLGTSDLEGQLSTLALQQAELTSYISSAEKDYLQKVKLYRSLGVLTGAFISVMLI